jgi:hypothetical protein
MNFRRVEPGMTLVGPEDNPKKHVFVVQKDDSQVTFFLVVTEPKDTIIHINTLSKSKWEDPTKIFVGMIERSAMDKWLLRKVFNTNAEWRDMR